MEYFSRVEVQGTESQPGQSASAAVCAGGHAGDPEGAALGQSGRGDGDPLRVPGGGTVGRGVGTDRRSLIASPKLLGPIIFSAGVLVCGSRPWTLVHQ